MSDQKTSQDTHSAISSQVSEDGAAPLSLQDGQQTGLFGQDHAPVSHSRQRGSKKAKQMSATYGPHGSASSKSVALQSFLESRLQALFPMDGSTECTLTWKPKDTPLGRRYCQLAPSMRPISVTDCGLWPTPTANNGTGAGDQGREGGLNLQTAACWATPNTMDHMDARSPDAMRRQFNTARPGRTAPANLREQVHPELYPKALWVTPSTRDYKDSAGMVAQRKDGKSREDQLPRQVFGVTQNGSSAETAKRGALNPEFVYWLMGFPSAWVCSVQAGMLSFQRSPRGSSKQQCKDTP